MKKKVFGVLLLTSLIFSVFLISSVNAESAFWSDLKAGNFVNAFNDLNPNGSTHMEWTVQVLFFFLVLIVVFGISDMLPFFGEKTMLSLFFSLIVSILAVFFLDSQAIMAALLAYSAMGVAVTAIIPFFIIAAISKKSHDKGYSYIGKGLWVAFIALLLYQVFDSIWSSNKPNWYAWVYAIVLLISLLMFLFEKSLYFRMLKANFEGDVDKSKALRAAYLTAEINRIDDRLATNIGADTEKILEARREKLAAQLAKLK